MTWNFNNEYVHLGRRKRRLWRIWRVSSGTELAADTKEAMLNLSEDLNIAGLN